MAKYTRTTSNRTVSDAARDSKEAARESALLARQKIRDEFKRAQKNMETYVQDHPAKAGFIAAGVGAALGAAVTAMMINKKH